MSTETLRPPSHAKTTTLPGHAQINLQYACVYSTSVKLCKSRCDGLGFEAHRTEISYTLRAHTFNKCPSIPNIWGVISTLVVPGSWTYLLQATAYEVRSTSSSTVKDQDKHTHPHPHTHTQTSNNFQRQWTIPQSPCHKRPVFFSLIKTPFCHLWIWHIPPRQPNPSSSVMIPNSCSRCPVPPWGVSFKIASRVRGEPSPLHTLAARIYGSEACWPGNTDWFVRPLPPQPPTPPAPAAPEPTPPSQYFNRSIQNSSVEDLALELL